MCYSTFLFKNLLKVSLTFSFLFLTFILFNFNYCLNTEKILFFSIFIGLIYPIVKKLIAIPSIWKKTVHYGFDKINPYKPLNIKTREEFLEYINNSTFSEDQSDKCLVEISAATNNTKLHRCPISDNCKQFLFAPSNFQGYGVTHR